MKVGSHSALRAVALVVLLVMLAGIFAGCSAQNANPVIAKVGKRNITYSQYYSVYNTYSLYYSYGMLTLDEGTADPDAALRQMAFNDLVDEYVAIENAVTEGYMLTPEEEAQAEEAYQEQIQQTLDSYQEEEGPELTEEEKTAALKAELKESGYKYDEFLKALKQNQRDNMLSTKLKDGVLNSVSVSDEEVRAWYDTEVEEETALYATTMLFYNDYMSAIYYGHMRPLVMPEGFSYVKQILIMKPKEDEEKDMDAIVAEVQARIDAGEDFDALIEEYNEDPGMDTYTDGYLIHEDIRAIYYTEFSDVSMALKVGEVSAPTKTEVGIHIVKKVADAPAGTIPFEDVQLDIYDSLLSERQTAAYQAALEQWKLNVKIKLYPKRLEYFGITSKAHSADDGHDHADDGLASDSVDFGPAPDSAS